MKKLLILTIALVMALSLAACGGNSDNGGNNSTNPPASNNGGDVTPSGNNDGETPALEHDEKLILPEGQAWVQEDITIAGYIFKSDGTYDYYDGTWKLQSNGTWSTSGSTLTIIQTDISPYNYTYSISGNTLTLRNPFGDEYAYEQKTEPSGN